MASIPSIFWIVPISGLVAVIFAFYLIKNVMKQDAGTPKMKEIGDMIFEGAWAFLKRQYTTIGLLSLLVAVIIGVLVAVLGGEKGIEGMTPLGIGWRTAVAFLVGAFCSSISGFIGMYIAVKSNVRCAAAAQKNLTAAVNVALRGGGVSGFLITARRLLLTSS